VNVAPVPAPAALNLKLDLTSVRGRCRHSAEGATNALGQCTLKGGVMSGYEGSGPKVELWEGESVGKQSSHWKEDC